MYLNCSRVKGRVATHETESLLKEQFQMKVMFKGELSQSSYTKIF